MRYRFKEKRKIETTGSDSDVSSYELLMKNFRKKEYQVPADLTSWVYIVGYRPTCNEKILIDYIVRDLLDNNTG